MSDGPIVMLSVFKAGTHLVRQLLQELTGLPFHEPPITPGRVDYRDPNQLELVPGTFYSWHLVPTPAVRARLRAVHARPVLVVRNLFDLAVSMYHHFADNIDADIGRGRNVEHYFRDISKDEGLSAIISGMSRPDFRWRGLGPEADHMVQMLELAAEYPCHITSYERLTGDKDAAVAALAAYLEIPLSQADRARIVAGSSFEAMRARATAAGHGSHYRKGRARAHGEELSPHHMTLIRDVVAREAPTLPALAAKAGFPEILATEIP
jgi:hypothetical protein